MSKQPAFRIILALTIGAFLALLVTGCGNRIVLVDDTALAANITQACPPLSKLAAGDGKAVTRWAVGTVSLYEDCRNKHAALVEIFKPKE